VEQTHTPRWLAVVPALFFSWLVGCKREKTEEQEEELPLV